MTRFYSTSQLSAHTGRSVRTICYHVKMGWLKPEPAAPGVQGFRFTESNVRKWLARHFPDCSLSAEKPRRPVQSRSKSISS